MKVAKGTGARRRRGAALILVLIFIAGVFALATSLLALSNSQVKTTAEQHRLRALQAVLRAGIAAAINEINRDRTHGPYDPGAEGVGAILGPKAADGLHEGVPVRASDGRSLGCYRTTLRKHGARVLLTVVAAAPSFRNPLQLVGAEAEVDPGTFQFGDRPLEFVGNPSGKDKKPADHDKDIEELIKVFKIKKADFSVTDPSLQVPAINSTDPLFHEAMSLAMDAEIAEGDVTVLGADPSNPGSPASGSATITNNPAGGHLTAETMTALSRGLADYAATQAPAGTNLGTAVRAAGGLFDDHHDADHHVSIGDGAAVVNVTLAEGIYYVPDDLKLKENVTITGAGTLIIDKKFKLEHGATLNWTGTVIIASPEDEKAELKVHHGGTLTVDGVLALVGEKKAKFQLDEGHHDDETVARIDGALLILTDAMEPDDDDADDKNDFKVKKDVELTVNGVLAIVGEHVHFKVEDEADLKVNGSLSMMFPDDAKKGLHKFEVKKEADMALTFSDPNIAEAVTDLDRLVDQVFGPTRSPLPVSVTTYWEPPARALVGAQETAIAGGAIGMEDM